MDRRSFLKWLGGTAAGVAAAPFLDLDKLLWVSGEKKIFLPSLTELIQFTVGDIFTLDGVYSVHPLSYRVLPVLQRFVVTSNVASDGQWSQQFPMHPQLIDKGPWQTVSNLPQLGQKLNIFNG